MGLAACGHPRYLKLLIQVDRLLEWFLAIRAIIQFMLEKQGARTAIERWGTDAVRRARAFVPVDLILLDLMFPDGVSGFDIFDELRREQDLLPIPIVAVSAMDPSVAVPTTRAKGFDSFIGKPLDAERFPDQVARILRGEPVWETP